MTHKFNKVSIGFLSIILLNVLITKLSKKSFLRPIVPSLFVTLRCNLGCTYCGLVKKHVEELSTEQTYKLLEKIRAHSQALSITGGEPLVRADIIDILKKAKQLNFAPIFFNTNALLMHKKEEFLMYVDYLTISLDSLNTSKWDKILDVNGASSIIIDNIKKYSQYQKKYGFRMMINPVITNDTIDDIYEIIDFCRQHGILVTPVPEDNWSNPDSQLISNDKYYKLINDIIKMKKNGGKHIMITNRYLEQILKFSDHNCFPTLVPRIYPDGSVFYPCTPNEEIYANLLDYPNLNTLLKEAHKRKGLPSCTKKSCKCFLSCFMEPTNMIEHPIDTLKEQLSSLR